MSPRPLKIWERVHLVLDLEWIIDTFIDTSTVSHVVKRFPDIRWLQDRNRFSVLSHDSLDDICQTLFALQISQRENVPFRVDYPAEVYIRLQRFSNFINVMHELKESDK